MDESESRARINDIIAQNSTLTFIENVRLRSLPSFSNCTNILYLIIRSSNEIAEIKELPPNLIQVECINTSCKTLPPLPETLRILGWTGSEIEMLILPLSLTTLDLYNSKLNKLPELPVTLEVLACEKTNITQYPPLPDTLLHFNCSRTDITCLPQLPPYLTYLDINRTPICELPERFPETLTTLRAFQMMRIPDNQPDEEPNNYAKRINTFQIHIANLKLALEERKSRKRIIARCKAIKGCLMEATWHPDRVLTWCDPNAFDYDE